MRYLALCCIAKNETPFLREWVAYHALRGVEHFYIYDNMSDEPIIETLKGYADPARVTVKRIHGKVRQLDAYQDCLDHYGAENRWIGFIDLDEFVLPMQDSDIRVLLSEFEEYAALGLTWRVFSSSGHLGRPRGGQLANYTEALLDGHLRNAHIKSFVNPARIAGSRNPHFFWYKPGGYAVTDEHLPIPPDLAYAPSLRKLARINHYFYRSQQDFEEKILRGRGTVADPALNNKITSFWGQTRYPVEEDREILRFWPPLKAALKTNSLPRPYMPDLPATASFPEYFSAAMALAEAGRTEDASVVLCHAAIQHSNQAELWFLRALLARSSGHLERAERFIKHALTLDYDPNAYLELASIHLMKGEKAQAEAVCRFLRFLRPLRDDMGPELDGALDRMESAILAAP
ncbi:glycosyltransferase family 92 protein [Desulfovibrio sp. OttesenSCG-928-I05]|nr:glycosyltransferase family 92 protein [Desulfovibrio sp. OttesenSCG-928-I05]